MALFTIDPQTCNQDGLCAAVCPPGVIDFSPGALPVPTADAEAVCIRCGHCVAVCPTASFTHREMAPADCAPLSPQPILSAEQCARLLHGRRSIRAYRQQPVDRATLARLIDLARYAPSGHNSQNTEWLVLSGREELRRLAGLVVEWMQQVQVESPELARAMHMERTVARWQAGHDVILRGAPVLIVTHAHAEDRIAPSSCTIALAHLELAATSLGLGTCWAGYLHAATAAFAPLVAALDLPEEHRCLGAMMVGYAKFRYQRVPTRRPARITWRLDE